MPRQLSAMMEARRNPLCTATPLAERQISPVNID